MSTLKTLKQAEKETGIKATALRKRIQRKTLKAIKLGRDWFIKESELERLKEQNENN